MGNMDRDPDPAIQRILDESKRVPWKERKKIEALDRRIFDLAPVEWAKLVETVESYWSEIQNIDTRSGQVARIKRDARICSATWITPEHIELVLLVLSRRTGRSLV